MVVTLSALTVWGVLRSEAFWRWSSRLLLDLAQKRLQVEIQVGDLKGHPLTGLTLNQVAVRTTEGEVLQVRRVEVRLSLWSFLKFQPVIGHLALVEPRLTLRADELGRFAAAPPPPAGNGQDKGLVLKSLSLSRVLVENGQVTYLQDGQTWRADGLEGSFKLDLLHPGQPQQMLLVRRASLQALTPWGPFSLTCRLTYGQHYLKVLSLALESRQRTWLTFMGDLHLENQEAAVQLAGELGPLPGEEIRRLLKKWPGAWETQGKFSLKGSMEHLEMNLEGRVAGAQCSGDVFLNRKAALWQAKGSFSLANLKPELLAPWNQTWAGKLAGLTPVSLRLEVQGNGTAWPPEQFTSTFICDPFRLGSRRLENLNLTLTGNPREQQLNGTTRGNFGKIALNAKGPLLTASRGEVQVRLEALRPHLLGLAGSPQDLWNGKFAGTFHLDPWNAPENLALAGDLEANGRLGGFPLQEARARLALEKSKINLSQVKFHWGNLKATAKGTVQGDRLDLQCEGNLAPGGEGPLPGTLQGQLIWQGKLTGALKAPRFNFQAKGTDLSLSGLKLQGLTLSASGESWPVRAGNLDLRVQGFTTPVGTFAQTTVTSEGSGNQWRFTVKAASPQGPRLELAGAAALGTRPLEVSLEQVQFHRAQVAAHNTGPLRLSLLPGFALGPATFRVNDGTITLEARTREGAVSGRVEMENLPAQLIAVKGQPLEGKIKGRLTLGGQAQQPTLEGQFSLAPGRLGEFSFQSLKATLGYQEGHLTTSGNLEHRSGGPRVTWDGRLPLRLSLIPFRVGWGEQDMHLRAQGDRTDLALLTALTPEVQSAKGPVDFGVEWHGPLAQPQVSGQVRWGPGSIKFRQAGIPYQLQPGIIRLQGNTLSFPQVVFENQGTAKVTGEIRLAGFSPEELNLRAHLENFKVLRRSGSEAFGSGTVFLKGSPRAPEFSGRLTVPRASFRPMFFETDIHEDIVLVGKPPPPPTNGAGANLTSDLAKNLQMDLTLATTGGVWIRDPRFKVELAGSIKITKKPGKAIITGGKLRTLQGNIDIQDRSFKVMEGFVNLPGAPHAPVTLEGRAIHEMKDITIVLNISGPAYCPELKFSSVPALPPADVLSYLMFGRPARTLNREEYQVVDPKALQAVGGITAKKLQEFLGKDFPLLGNVTLKGDEDRVGVCKPLTKDLSVSFERKTNPTSRDDENQVRLEYRIKRWLGVESQMGQRNPGADVFFNLDF